MVLCFTHNLKSFWSCREAPAVISWHTSVSVPCFDPRRCRKGGFPQTWISPQLPSVEDCSQSRTIKYKTELTGGIVTGVFFFFFPMHAVVRDGSAKCLYVA